MFSLEVSYLGVFLAAIAAMIVGGLWYSPLLFGNHWVKLMGYSKADVEAAKKKGMARGYALGFVSALLTSWVLALLILWFGATNYAAAAQLAFWVWLGFNVTIFLHNIAWENKPWGLFVINALHNLVSLLVAAAILLAL